MQEMYIYDRSEISEVVMMMMMMMMMMMIMMITTILTLDLIEDSSRYDNWKNTNVLLYRSGAKPSNDQCQSDVYRHKAKSSP